MARERAAGPGQWRRAELEDWRRVSRSARGAERDARGRAVRGRKRVVDGGCMCVRGGVHFMSLAYIPKYRRCMEPYLCSSKMHSASIAVIIRFVYIA
jgi:hypothetical protein